MQAENQLSAAIAGEAREIDFAAAGLAAQALNGGAILREDHGAGGLRNSIRHIHDIERRLLESHAAVNLRVGEGPAHRGVSHHSA